MNISIDDYLNDMYEPKEAYTYFKQIVEEAIPTRDQVTCPDDKKKIGEFMLDILERLHTKKILQDLKEAEGAKKLN